MKMFNVTDELYFDQSNREIYNLIVWQLPQMKWQIPLYGKTYANIKRIKSYNGFTEVPEQTQIWKIISLHLPELSGSLLPFFLLDRLT